MEFNVSFLVDQHCGLLSGSIAELGQDAGRITWNNCLELAIAHPLATDDNREELESYFRDYGAWTAEEIAAWSLQELSALCIQEAASNFRQFEDYCGSDWDKYREECENGSISGQIWPDETGRVFCSFCR
jgi:hypothetical protein